MKKSLLFLLLLCLVFGAEAKGTKDFKAVRITYRMSFNNKPDSTSTTTLEISGNKARISYTSTRQEKDDPIQNTYLDYTTNTETKVARLNGDETIFTTRNFVVNDGLTPQPETETEKIAGYNCKKATASINSNRIEIWYTTELGVMGSMQPGTAIPNGVVLKIVRNGQQEQKAVKVELLKEAADLAPYTTGEQLTAPAYNYKIQQSKVISVDVFDHQSIYFRNIPKPADLNTTEVLQFANGSIVLRKVTLPAENSGYAIFAELSQHSEGDAYDRTGSVFIVPTDRKQSFFDGLMTGREALPQYTDKHGDKYEGMTVTNDYLPPLELMRFYTSFGVRGFNHIQVAGYNWPDSVVFKQEVTDYAKVLKGEVWVGTWIGNYAEKGHNVSLKIKYYPNDRKEPKEVYPLFATVNIMEMAGQAYPEGMFRNDSLSVNFETATDLKNAYIRYISTGHGGWGGGDEFNPKLNELFLDSKRIIAYTPWREDCGSYRERNPASGNFANGQSSSDLSRSGWCPGTVSYPVFVHVGDIKAGKHQLKIAIPVGDPEGSSHSYWCISGVLVGDK